MAVPRLISASDLKRQRGWTETLITALLGAPDALCPNPHGFRHPMRFFREDRVLDAERLPVFNRRIAQLTTRQAWRRAQPTRVRRADEVDGLEWLEDPHLLALFHSVRGQRKRRPRPARRVAAPGVRFEVLRLF